MIIERQQGDYSRHLTFLGANQDAFAEAGAMGIMQGDLTARQDQLAQAQGNIATSLIGLYKALGGGWQIRCPGLQRPESVPQEPAMMEELPIPEMDPDSNQTPTPNESATPQVTATGNTNPASEEAVLLEVLRDASSADDPSRHLPPIKIHR